MPSDKDHWSSICWTVWLICSCLCWTSVAREQLLQTEEYDLNVVRLCIQVYLQDESGHYTRPLNPIVTNPIYDNREYPNPVRDPLSESQHILMKGNTADGSHQISKQCSFGFSTPMVVIMTRWTQNQHI